MICSFFLSDVVSRQVGRSFSKSFQFQVEVVNKRFIYQVNLCFWIAERAYGGRYRIESFLFGVGGRIKQALLKVVSEGST